jgi:hypothetical protein
MTITLERRGVEATTRGARGMAVLSAVAPYAVASGIVLLVALWTYVPWRTGSAIAFPIGDSLSFHAWVQNVQETGWYEHTDRLNAPNGQNSHSYPVTDELLFFVVGRLLVPLTGSVAAAVMAWVVLCFPLAAIAAVAVSRYLGLSRVVSVLPGVAFALLPDHFFRSSGHYSLASQWAVPLGVLVAVSLLRAPSLAGRGRWAFELGMLTSCVAISLTNAYYAVFTGILVAAAGLGGAVIGRSWRVLMLALGRGLALVMPLAVALLIDRAGTPDDIGYPSSDVTRMASDAETYGGKIAAMLMPAVSHPWAAARSFRAAYDVQYPNAAESPSLGLLASVGFVGLVVWSVLRLWSPKALDPSQQRLGLLAGLNWVSVLAYTVGGVGTVWAVLLGGGGVRAWSRFHLVIALLSLLAVAHVLHRLRRRWQVLLVVVLLAVVLLDQTSRLYRPDVARAHAVQTEVTSLTDQIERRTGPDAQVFQLPAITYPVPNLPTQGGSGYDGLLPYLYSTDLDWSFGGFQGDPDADWQQELARRPVQEQVPLLTAAGFEGILLDTASDPSGSLVSELRAVLGEPAVVSSSGRWQYFPLPSNLAACTPAQTDTLRDAALEAPELYPGAGLTRETGTWTSDQPTSTLRLTTEHDGGWSEVAAGFTIDAGARYRITLPTGEIREVASGQTRVEWTGPLQGPQNVVRLERLDPLGAFTLLNPTAEVVLQAQDLSCASGALR